jgi:lysophospholipase L1-like esterase
MSFKNRVYGLVLLVAVTLLPALALADNPRKGDMVAICGDSITEQKDYSVLMEAYLMMCQPAAQLRSVQFGWGGETSWGFLGRMSNDVLWCRPDVATTCYGMNDGGYSPMTEEKAKHYRDSQKGIVQAFKKAGTRMIIVGSPGVVDADTFRRNPEQAAMYNKTLAGLRDIARQVAQEEGVLFANVFDPMMDVMTKANNLSWKKLQFARAQDSKVSLDQIKNGILALATMPLVGLAVNDPATKTSAVFAKNMPTEADASKLALPDGYSWTTVYVVLAPEPVATPSSSGNKLADLNKNCAQQLVDVASLSPEERKQYYANQWQQTMNLSPEARQAMLHDQMQAMRDLPQQQRDELRKDLRSAFGGGRGQRPQGQNQGGNRARRSN